MKRKDFLSKIILTVLGYAVLSSRISNIGKSYHLIKGIFLSVRPKINDFTINKGTIYLKENKTNRATFTITLSEPENVKVTITSKNGFITFNKAQLSFTYQNHNIPQRVSVTGKTNEKRGAKYDDIIVKTNGKAATKNVRIFDSSIDPAIYNIEPLSRMHWDMISDLNKLRQNTIDWIWGTGYCEGDGIIPVSKQPSKVEDHLNDKYINTSGITGISKQKN